MGSEQGLIAPCPEARDHKRICRHHRHTTILALFSKGSLPVRSKGFDMFEALITFECGQVEQKVPCPRRTIIAQDLHDLFENRNVTVNDGIGDDQRLTVTPFFDARQLFGAGNDQYIIAPGRRRHTQIDSYNWDHINMTLSSRLTRIANN